MSSNDMVWYQKYDGDEDDEFVKSSRANDLIEYARELEQVQSAIHRQNLINYQLYNNRYLSSFDWGTGIYVERSLEPVARTTDNVILQVIDSLVAEIGKNRPKAKPVVFGASWKENRAARKLDKFLYGEFIRNDMYKKAKMAFLNSLVCGFGCLKVLTEDSSKNGARIKIENIFPDDILIDQAQVLTTGKISSLVERHVLPIEVVSARYDIPIEELKAAAEGDVYLQYRKKATDWIVVVEGYQLHGRHVIAIKDRIILDEPWDEDWIPYIFYHWQNPQKGFYSQSAVEQALPNQINLNEINQVIKDAQDLMSKPRILVHKGSQVNPVEINNLVGKIIQYTGIEPKAITWPAVSVELYNEREREIRVCFNKFGLNPNGAQGGLPSQARLDSSAAVREYNQIQDNRLADPAQRYEEFFLDVAKMMVRVIKISGKSPKTVWFSGGRKARAEEICWDDVDLDENAYTMILESASSFTMTPSAQRDELEDLFARGLITPEEYKRERSLPDLQNMVDLQTAGLEDIYRVRELLEDGKYESPIPKQDLINGVKHMTLAMLALNQYTDDTGELDKIKLNFINWITEAEMWLNKGAEKPPQAPLPMTAPPTMPLNMAGMGGLNSLPVG
jgi:hypothetical protein